MKNHTNNLIFRFLFLGRRNSKGENKGGKTLENMPIYKINKNSNPRNQIHKILEIKPLKQNPYKKSKRNSNKEII